MLNDMKVPGWAVSSALLQQSQLHSKLLILFCYPFVWEEFSGLPLPSMAGFPWYWHLSHSQLLKVVARMSPCFLPETLVIYLEIQGNLQQSIISFSPRTEWLNFMSYRQGMGWTSQLQTFSCLKQLRIMHSRCDISLMFYLGYEQMGKSLVGVMD